MIAQGFTNREVAEKLLLSVKTVEGYRARIARKIDADGRRDLVRFALAHGLLQAGG